MLQNFLPAEVEIKEEQQATTGQQPITGQHSSCSEVAYQQNGNLFACLNVYMGLEACTGCCKDVFVSDAQVRVRILLMVARSQNCKNPSKFLQRLLWESGDFPPFYYCVIL